MRGIDKWSEPYSQALPLHREVLERFSTNQSSSGRPQTRPLQADYGASRLDRRWLVDSAAYTSPELRDVYLRARYLDDRYGERLDTCRWAWRTLLGDSLVRCYGLALAPRQQLRWGSRLDYAVAHANARCPHRGWVDDGTLAGDVLTEVDWPPIGPGMIHLARFSRRIQLDPHRRIELWKRSPYADPPR